MILAANLYSSNAFLHLGAWFTNPKDSISGGYNWVLIKKKNISNMSVEALPLHNSIDPTMANLFQETSSLVHALAKTSPCKASPCTRGPECWGQFFHTTWPHFIGDPHHVNITMNFGRIYFKAQKSPYSRKWCRSPWSKTHGDIISSSWMMSRWQKSIWH